MTVHHNTQWLHGRYEFYYTTLNRGVVINTYIITFSDRVLYCLEEVVVCAVTWAMICALEKVLLIE